LGKFSTPFSKTAPKLIQALTHFSRLHSVKLAQNNLRGDLNGNIDKLLACFVEMNSLKSLDLSGNTLGLSYGN
jgi:hypothetical protein